MVVEHGVLRAEPWLRRAVANGAETQREPIGQIDHVLVLDLPSADGRGEAVVAACRVGAWVVHRAGRALRSGTAGGEIAVSQRAQGFPQGH